MYKWNFLFTFDIYLYFKIPETLLLTTGVRVIDLIDVIKKCIYFKINL